jgi:hypothetical protein
MTGVILLGAISEFLNFFNSLFGKTLCVVLPVIVVAIILLHNRWARWSLYKKKSTKNLLSVPFLVGGPLLLSGLIGIYTLKRDSPFHSIFEAIVVAGVIVAFVDPIMKWRLLSEFAKDLFPYMMGFELPQKIQERLRDMISITKLYRQDMTMHLRFCLTGTHEVKIHFVTKFQLVNPTSSKIKYTHHLTFEEAEQLQSLTVTLPHHSPCEIKVDDEERLYDDSGDYPYSSEAIEIEPDGTCRPYCFSSEYLLKNRTLGFHLQRFGQPTIGFKLTLEECPDELEVMVTIPEGQKATINRARGGNKEVEGGKGISENLEQGNSIGYEKVLMTGDSINIRWRPFKKSSCYTLLSGNLKYQ